MFLIIVQKYFLNVRLYQFYSTQSIALLLMLTLVVGGRGTETTVLLWFARLFTPLISLVVTKCVRPLRGRLLLTPTAAGYVPLALHPRL